MFPIPVEPGNDRTAWVFKDAPGLEAWSTEPLPALDPTILLLHGDGAHLSTTFTDHSGYSRTITRVGQVDIRNDTAAYGSTSIRIQNDIPSYLIVEDVRLLNLFDYDCTIEFWVYHSDNLNQWMMSSYDSAEQNGWGISIFTDGSRPNGCVAFGRGNTPEIKSADGSFPINTWHHVAVTTLDRTVSLWLNGALVGSLSSSAVSSIKNTGNIYIGTQANGGSFGNNFRGYLQEIRILQGSAAFTAPFTPPLSAYADLAEKTPFVDRPDIAAVQLAVHFNGINGGNIIVSQGSTGRRLTNSGVTFSTTQSKFGGSSGYFNGTAYCSGPSGGNFATDNWIARCWVYVTANVDDLVLFSGNDASIFDNFYVKRVAGTWYVGNGAVDPIAFADAAFSLNQWYYIEATHLGSTYYLFKDGQLLTSAVATPSNTSTSVMRIGGQIASALALTGYIQEAEFILGASASPRTSNYTVPTTDFIPHDVWPPSP